MFVKHFYCHVLMQKYDVIKLSQNLNQMELTRPLSWIEFFHKKSLLFDEALFDAFAWLLVTFRDFVGLLSVSQYLWVALRDYWAHQSTTISKFHNFIFCQKWLNEFRDSSNFKSLLRDGKFMEEIRCLWPHPSLEISYFVDCCCKGFFTFSEK